MYGNTSQLPLTIGSVVSDHTAHKCISRNTAKPVIRPETVHPDIRLRRYASRRVIGHIYHICTDTAAYIEGTCDAYRLYFKFIFQNPCRGIQTDTAACPISGSIDPPADQNIILLQAAGQIPVYVVKSNHASHKVPAHYQAGNRLHGYVPGITEPDLSVIVSCHSSYTVARIRLPGLCHHAVNGLAVV